MAYHIIVITTDVEVSAVFFLKIVRYFCLFVFWWIGIILLIQTVVVKSKFQLNGAKEKKRSTKKKKTSIYEILAYKLKAN